MVRDNGYGSLSALLALLLAGIILSVPAGAVTLRESAKVALPPFTLQDVTQEKLSGELAGIKLGQLPRPGRTRFISRAYIKLQARSQDKSIPRFEGSVHQMEVSRPVRTIGGEELREHVRELLNDELAVTDSVTVEIRKVPESLKILPGPFSLKLNGWNPYRKERGRTNYRVTVRQRGTSITRFRVIASITQENKVPVATQPIARGQTVTEDMIQWKEREISSLDGNIIRREKEIIGFKADNSFDAGDVITGGDIRRPTLINRGDPVTIVLKQNGFRVTTKGEAQDQGALGDRIMVENLSSEVELLAEVIGERRVLIRDADE
jgi:flagella basal body P-ring formation protein FlgA